MCFNYNWLSFRSSTASGNFTYPAVAMVYGMENGLTQTAAVREPQSVQTHQHTRGLPGKRPSRFDYQQSTGVFPVRETARTSFHPHRMTADFLDIQRTWLCLPTLANIWKLWLCRSWDSSYRRVRDQTTENYSSPLLLIVRFITLVFSFHVVDQYWDSWAMIHFRCSIDVLILFHWFLLIQPGVLFGDFKFFSILLFISSKTKLTCLFYTCVNLGIKFQSCAV